MGHTDNNDIKPRPENSEAIPEVFFFHVIASTEHPQIIRIQGKLKIKM